MMFLWSERRKYLRRPNLLLNLLNYIDYMIVITLFYMDVTRKKRFFVRPGTYCGFHFQNFYSFASIKNIAHYVIIYRYDWKPWPSLGLLFAHGNTFSLFPLFPQTSERTPTMKLKVPRLHTGCYNLFGGQDVHLYRTSDPLFTSSLPCQFFLCSIYSAHYSLLDYRPLT